jgi:hypothetical protein
MSDSKDSNPSEVVVAPDEAARRARLLDLLKQNGADGGMLLSGNEAALANGDKVLLEQFNANARKMGIHPLPYLLLFGQEADHSLPQALSAVSDDGTTAIVVMTQSMKKAMEAGTRADGTAFTSSPLEREVAVAVHEEVHIKRNKAESKPAFGLKQKKRELVADRDSVRATCNPQALEDALESLVLATARTAGITLQQAEDAAAGPSHPTVPVRMAQLEHIKAHPSRGCKAK